MMHLQPILKFLGEHLAALWAIVPLSCVAIGVLLCFAGGRLVRPTSAVCGITLGMAGGFLASQQLATDHWLALWVLGGALLGGVMVWALFRLWMGMGLAVVLVMVLPAMILILQHNAPPLAVRTMIAQQSKLPSFYDTESSRNEHSDIVKPTSPTPQEVAMNKITQQHSFTQGMAVVSPGLVQQRHALSNWWHHDISADCKRLLWVVAIVAAVVGLVIGLTLPGMAARIQTSTFGAFLLLLGLRELVLAHLPSYRTSWVPADPKVALIALGLITITGIFLQWSLSHRPTDK